uniref:DNA repair protein RAD50 n=1 Tax=Arcella intermedia TaxID=1963864 RepID=A0A6B2KY77_9EUKA
MEQDEKIYEQKLAAVKDDLIKYLGQLPEPSKIKGEIEAKLKACKSKIEKKQKKLDAARANCYLMKNQAEEIDKVLKEKNKLLTTIKKKLEPLKERPLPDVLKEIDQELDDTKEELTKLKSAEIMYKNFIKMASKSKCCPLCDRDLNGKVEPFVQKLQETLQQVPESYKSSSSELANQEKIKVKLSQLQPDYNLILQINKEIPELLAKKNTFQENEIVSSEQLSKISPKLEQEKLIESKLLFLAGVAEDLNTRYLMNAKLRETKENEENKLKKKKLFVEGKTVEECLKEVETLQSESDKCAHMRDELSSTYQKNMTELNSLEGECNNLSKQLLELRNSNANVLNFKQKVEQFKQDILHDEEEIEKFEDLAQQKKSEMKKLIAERAKFNEECLKIQQEFSADKDKFMNCVIKLEHIHNQISSTVGEEFNNKLQQVAQKKKTTEAKLEKIVKQIQKLEGDIQNLNAALSDQEGVKRNLEDNIRWKKKQQECKNRQRTLEKMQDMATTKINPNIATELKLIAKEIVKLRSDHDKCEGSRLTHQDTVNRRKKDLSSKNYVNVDEEYRLILINMQTTEMVVKDLEKYFKALDKALMKFHSMKMSEINQILKEYWQATYKGNDIEWIEIQADIQETEKRRTYNYRVVMMKGGTPLNMKGRCSAGQKVLASLIIRLALAETFCVNCGILALDEPTTNLDRHNIESFALALLKIINNRKNQRNFQIIIITHDEEFVQLLGRSEHADYYWRITKDSKGYSTIERHQIVEM